jgi:hypothetical protein
MNGLGPIGARLIEAGLFFIGPISNKRLLHIHFIRSFASEKSAGLQDHTTSPSASVPFVVGTSASTASHRTFRDDREPPLLSGETGGFKSLICPTGQAEYFPQRGLTRGVRRRASDLPVGQSGRKGIRQCEPTGGAKRHPLTGSAKQAIARGPKVPIPGIQVHAAVCTRLAGFCSTKSGYVSILFMKMNGTR